MNTKAPFLLVIAAIIISGTATASAHENKSRSGLARAVSQVEMSQPNARHQAPYGYATAGPVERVVKIESGTRYLNVTRLETIGIEIDGKRVTWTFDTLGTRAFLLSEIIPCAVGVTVYIEESPLYRGG